MAGMTDREYAADLTHSVTCSCAEHPSVQAIDCADFGLPGHLSAPIGTPPETERADAPPWRKAHPRDLAERTVRAWEESAGVNLRLLLPGHGGLARNELVLAIADGRRAEREECNRQHGLVEKVARELLDVWTVEPVASPAHVLGPEFREQVTAQLVRLGDLMRQLRAALSVCACVKRHGNAAAECQCQCHGGSLPPYYYVQDGGDHK